MDKRKIRAKNPIYCDYDKPLEVESEEESIKSGIRMLTELWEYLGIEGTPTEDDIINRPNAELETILLVEKSDEYERGKRLQSQN